MPGMRARRWGRVLNVTSSAVKAPLPLLGLSTGARSGLTGFVAGLAREVAADGVTVNNLPAGFVRHGAHKVSVTPALPLLPGLPFTAYGVNTAWGPANRATVVSFLRAVHQGVEWLYEPKNKDEAIAILIKATGAKPEDSAKTYELFFNELRAFRRDGSMPAEGFRRLLDAVTELGDLPKPPPPAAKFVDDSYLKAAFAGR